MFSLVLLCLPQAPAPEAAEWWNKLTPEQQVEMRQRIQRYREMPPEAREEMRRRSAAVRRLKKHELERMDPEGRKEIESMSHHDRRQYFDRMLRGRFERHERHLRDRIPGAHDKLHNRPIHVRLMVARRFVQEHRAQGIQERLSVLASEGWIGNALSGFLNTTTPIVQATVLQEISRWRTFANASKAGLFQEWGLTETDIEFLSVLPGPEFYMALQRLKSGEPKSAVIKAPHGRSAKRH
ncbi:MAG: DUF3106 domain-containing protein [Planctomycetota bacterium]|jgi:hypothetical protein|nr:DUF3106 domain-containing protein [Planctomycetota bacterium]MDP6940912.1 DUF3106 domain-containing protein [Planctomycetota bacterium]